MSNLDLYKHRFINWSGILSLRYQFQFACECFSRVFPSLFTDFHPKLKSATQTYSNLITAYQVPNYSEKKHDPHALSAFLIFSATL